MCTTGSEISRVGTPLDVPDRRLTLTAMTAIMNSATQITRSLFRSDPMKDEAKPPYVFVSYGSTDISRVTDMVHALHDAGIATWQDQTGISGGMNYGPEIATAIRDCAVLLLCCSSASMGSRNVRQEIALAWKHERPI